MSADRLGADVVAAGIDVPTYALSTVVYLERGEEILLLQRAEGTALAGQWFLPGGAVERGELPEDGARRELLEEAGVEVDGELEMIGAYPMQAYGLDILQLSYRGRLAEGPEVSVSDEHVGAQWVRATDMRALLDDRFIEEVAAGDDRIRSLLGHIVADLDRYLRRVGG